MNKNNIELKIIEKGIDMNIIKPIDLLNFIILEVEELKELKKKGAQKKQLVLDIIEDFIRDADNIFCKSNNHDVIYSLLNLKNSNIIGDIIDNIIYCANGNLYLNSTLKKKKFFCLC